MSEVALTRRLDAALARVAWLDEAIARREWRRLVRQMAAGRWPGLFALFVLALWLPALAVGGPAPNTSPDSHWPFASLGIAICICSLCTGFLRASQLWNAEAHSQSLASWLISLMQPRPVALAAALGASVAALLISLPALALLLLVALGDDVSPAILLGVLAFDLVVIVTGAAAGSASFFLPLKALAPRSLLLGATIVTAVWVALWLRVEYVEAGWRGPWELHPDRLTFALLLLTPLPHLLGLTDHTFWVTSITTRLACPLPAAVTTALLACGYLGLTAHFLRLSEQGFRTLRADPERLERRTERVEEVVEPGSEFYWMGFRNPIWTREIRTRLRSREAVEIILFASILTAGAGFFPLLTAGSQIGDPLQTAGIAREVFGWLTMALGIFVMLITPGLTAEAITIEREHGTLELLLCSPLRPREILHGKLLGAISILLLLLSPSLPLFALCTVFHGASVGQVLGVYAVLGCSLALCAYFGVTSSAIHRQMLSAKGQAYLLAILAGVFPPGYMWLLALLAWPSSQDPATTFAGAVYGGMGFLACLFAMALLWGFATERLQYIEDPPMW